MTRGRGPRAFDGYTSEILESVLARWVVMGVSGSGKTTVGRSLADRLGVPFFDADNFHPPANIAKMSRGEALDDEDRRPWLETLANVLREHPDCVVTCSALKRRYREMLREGGDASGPVRIVYLRADYETIAARMDRPGHFFPAKLLRSQFEALEEPGGVAGDDAAVVDAARPVDQVVAATLAAWR